MPPLTKYHITVQGWTRTHPNIGLIAFVLPLLHHSGSVYGVAVVENTKLGPLTVFIGEMMCNCIRRVSYIRTRGNSTDDLVLEAGSRFESSTAGHEDTGFVCSRSGQPLTNKSGEIDYEAIVKLSDGFNGADLRNVVIKVAALR